MIGNPPAGTTPSWPGQQATAAIDEQQEAANMLLVVQAIQRLHTAFDAIFIHPKNMP